MINYDEDINCCSCCRSCPPPIWLFVLRDPRATVFLLVRVCQIWSLTTVPSGSAQCETCQSVAHCGSQENINNLSPHTHTHKHRRRNVQKHLQSVNLYIAGGEETHRYTLLTHFNTLHLLSTKSQYTLSVSLTSLALDLTEQSVCQKSNVNFCTWWKSSFYLTAMCFSARPRQVVIDLTLHHVEFNLKFRI